MTSIPSNNGIAGSYGEKLTFPIIAEKDLPEILKKRIAEARKDHTGRTTTCRPERQGAERRRLG